jgi:hypothetical protein
MEVTLSGITVFMHPAMIVFVAVSIIALHPLRESYFVLPSSTTMEVNLLQPRKAEVPIEVTLLGIVMEVRAHSTYLQLVVIQRF